MRQARQYPGPHRGLRALSLALCALSGTAEAGVVVHGTRVIYPSDRREVTMALDNGGEAPALVQAWIDDGDQPGAAAPRPVPFVITPAIFRVEPRQGQSLRIIYTGKPLAADRETVFWLNVLDIPPKAAPNPGAPNRLDFAFRHRLKLFFRPAALSGDPARAATRLTWALHRATAGECLVATNPTPFHISITRLELLGADRPVTARPEMIAPFATASFALGGVTSPSPAAQVRFEFLDDFGARRELSMPLGPAPTGTAGS